MICMSSTVRPRLLLNTMTWLSSSSSKIASLLLTWQLSKLLLHLEVSSLMQGEQVLREEVKEGRHLVERNTDNHLAGKQLK